MSNYHFLKEYTFKNGAKVKNRIVMAPMTTMSAFFDGTVSNDEIAYYSSRAGGPGMLVTAVAYVTMDGQGFEGQLSAANNAMIPGLEKMASVIKKDGTKAILQIFHAGRKSDSKVLRGTQPVSASNIIAVFPKSAEQPRPLEEDEILQIIKDFGSATKRAIKAGFDGVELHGANGYLLQQFFSPHSNRRTDDWGGEKTARMKFANAVIREVRQAINDHATSDFIFGYRISPEEIETPGLRLEDTLYFADAIKNQVDYIHLSLRNYKMTSLNNKEDNETIVQKFKTILKEDVPLIAVGGIELPKDAEEALELGADFAAMGKQLLKEPKWVQKVLNGDENTIRAQISPVELEDLSIPGGMRTYLTTFYKDMMNYTMPPKEYSAEEETAVVKRFINHA